MVSREPRRTCTIGRGLISGSEDSHDTNIDEGAFVACPDGRSSWEGVLDA